MTLGEKQRLFAKLLPALLNQAHTMGYEVTLGDAYRDPRLFGAVGEKKGYGHKKSNHKRRLAIDLNLFLEGRFLTETEDHFELGQWWESLHPLCRWGGRFTDKNGNPKPDGNHYSLEHEGYM